MRSSKQNPLPLEQPDVVTIRGVDYFIYWDKVAPGCSFFLPTTVSPQEVLRELRPFATKMEMYLKAHTRCEYGRYGVRVWRIS
jgi:hypothetical protein